MSCLAEKYNNFIDIAEYLKKTPIFANIGEDFLQKFINSARLQSTQKGKVLFIQGDDAKCFYLILHGWVKLFRETIEGEEAVIDVLNDDHIFGENSVFENNIHSYSAEILEPTQYITIPTSILKQSIESDKQIALNMLSSMSKHRRQQRSEIEHLNIQNAPQRIGCFLLRLCPVDSSGIIKLHLPYDKMLIAARLGMKPETFSRALSKLKAETNIKINGPTVTIKNLQQLSTYTCNHCSSSFPCEDMKS